MKANKLDERGGEAKTPVGSFSIVPQKMFDEPSVEEGRVEEFSFVKINVLFLDGAVEPFGMGIHLRSLRKGVPVNLVKPPNLGIKGFHELGTVVREDIFQRERKEEGHKVEELFGSLGGMTRRPPGKGPTSVDIGKGDNVPTGAMDDLFNGIKSSTVPRRGCDEIPWFSDSFRTFSLNDLSIVTHLHREHPESPKISDEIAHRGGRGAGEPMRSTEDLKGVVHFLLPEIRVQGSLAFDLGNDVGRPGATSDGLRTF
jgi:hypothetical protein